MQTTFLERYTYVYYGDASPYGMCRLNRPGCYFDGWKAVWHSLCAKRPTFLNEKLKLTFTRLDFQNLKTWKEGKKEWKKQWRNWSNQTQRLKLNPIELNYSSNTTNLMMTRWNLLNRQFKHQTEQRKSIQADECARDVNKICETYTSGT